MGMERTAEDWPLPCVHNGWERIGGEGTGLDRKGPLSGVHKGWERNGSEWKGWERMGLFHASTTEWNGLDWTGRDWTGLDWRVF